MKINDVVEFYIEGRDELCRFFHYAKENDIQWVNSLGDGDFMVAYVKPDQRNKLYEFVVYYSKLNTKFKEGDIVQFYRDKGQPIGTISEYRPSSNTFTVILESGKKRRGVESHQLLHHEKILT